MVPRALALPLVASLLGAAPSIARADDEIPGHRVDPPTDLSLTVGALAASAAAMAIPVRDPDKRWDEELWSSDEGVKTQFSHRAAKLSDLTVGLGLVAPLAYLSGTVIDDADGDRLAIYAETIAIDLALVQLTKHLVQRPRPYLYNKSPAAVAFAKTAGKDANLSFYSSHAALSFGAATAGAYLLGASNAHPTARLVAWGLGFANAALTADLRVRSGRHFYSDVAIGAAVGIAVGYAVPALHARTSADVYTPTGGEIALAAGGILAGAVLGQLIPLGGAPGEARRFDVTPLVVRDGAGVGLGGSF